MLFILKKVFSKIRHNIHIFGHQFHQIIDKADQMQMPQAYIQEYQVLFKYLYLIFLKDYKLESHISVNQIMDNELIGEQIEQLREKAHTQSIKIISQNCFFIMYSPHSTNSPYSHLVFNIKLIIPEKFPDTPPFLYFADKVYHLNIDPVSGQVSMPILKEDWSPYITLSTVFENLDNILEEPDMDYAATQILKSEYTNQPQKYAIKVNQMVNLSSPQAKEDVNQSVVQHVEQIAQFKSSDEMLLNNSFEKRQQEENVVPLQQSRPIADIPNNLKDIKESPIRQKEKEIRIQAFSENNSLLRKKTSQFNLKNERQSPQIKITKPISVQNEKEKLMGESLTVLKKSLSRKKQEGPESKEQFNQIQLNLKKSDQLIQLLLEGCQSMQNTLSKSQNSRVKQIIQKKLDYQWKMVQELLQISSQLKQKLFNSLKLETRNLLK